jgi:hypothetical protein
LLVGERHPEVAVQQLLEIDDVLLPQRVVEPELHLEGVLERG